MTRDVALQHSDRAEYLPSHINDDTAALAMTEWFPDYLYGVIEAPDSLPPLTQKRLERQFGKGELAMHLSTMRDSLMVFEDEDQARIVSYICGFSDETFEAVQGRSILEIQALLDPIFNLPEQPEQITSVPEVSQTTAAMNPEQPVPAAERIRVTRKKRVTKVLVHGLVNFQPAGSPLTGDQLSGAGESYIGPTELAWQSDALCAETDPEAFFPEKGGSTRNAKRICKTCNVKQVCLQYALGNDERFGIWGGLSERERRKLRKEENAAELV